ncbi:MAG: acyl-CoA dehydrogenase family protein [Hyphomonadaceae bacterium]|nr:acyl-CoA dehydrogenase family protein [Hyphomonadaceae bacterium]
MTPFRPRAHLATHEVTNQPAPLEDVNFFSADAMLIDAVRWSGADKYRDRIAELGARVGSAETQGWSAEANKATPIFKPFDRYGHRIDEVEFHPSYHKLMALGLDAGVSACAWREKENGHALHAGLFILMSMADHGVCCPMSMTYAVVPALRREPSVADEWVPRVAASAYDERFIPASEKRGATMGMAMTEKQGGSDVRANTTQATPSADGDYTLQGHKWFCSAPMSDAFLTLAYAPGGLTCFIVPRWKPDGERNAIEIQRLKDKVGDRSNASSEIEYRNAVGRRVGEEGKGVRTIIEMVNLTRLDCIIGSAAQMRQAVALAAWHAQGRSAFQRRLIDQPLMRAVIADLSLDAEMAVALAFRLARAIDEGEEALKRIGLPLGKFLTSKRSPIVLAEAMECHGGAGFVEEGPIARIFRQSPLNAIWEGSGNVIALDLLRALARETDARDAYLAEVSSAKGASRTLDAAIDEAATLLTSPIPESQARRAAERLALTLAAAILAQHAPSAVSDAFAARRLKPDALNYGAGAAAIDENALLARAALAA